MALRYFTQNVDFIANHVFSALHKLFVDDLDGIELVAFDLTFAYC